MGDGEKDKVNQLFEGRLAGKLSVRLGRLEFSGEGDQAFLAAQFQRFVEAIPAAAIEAEEPDKPTSGGSDAQPGKFTASLASHIKARAAESNQNRRFLATADWLRLRGMETITTAAVSKALIDNRQSRLANSAESLNRNVAKGYCEKVSNGFYITPEGLKELGYCVTTPADALATIPSGLRDPLLAEYREITRNYAEHRWRPSELSGGIFCEIVYTILHGHAANAYAASPSKPDDFPTACKALEKNMHVPRSFRILIPRALPALFEIRNNRGVGHAGGDVDSNHMDATLVLAMANWVMAELVRVFHTLPIKEAQALVDALADRRIPLVWEGGSMRRVLDPSMKLWEQIIILVASKSGTVVVTELLDWTGYDNKSYFMRTLREFHAKRWIELSQDETTLAILPPGTEQAAQIVARAEIGSAHRK